MNAGSVAPVSEVIAGSPPRLLFVPGGGHAGFGEIASSLVLAEEASIRWPGALVVFAIRKEVPQLMGDPFERVDLPRGSAERRRFAEILAQVQPDLVLFNNRGSRRMLRLAREAGAGVVSITSTGRRRRSGRLVVLRHLHQLWVFSGEGSAATTRLPSRWIRWLAGRPVCAVMEAVHPRPDAARALRLRKELALGEADYLLFSAGGGGYELDGRPVGRVFAEAAERAAQETGLPTVLVLGPLHSGDIEASPRIRLLRVVRTVDMVDLISGAAVVVTSGGGQLAWTLSMHRPCVTTPMPCSDQLQRVSQCRQQGTALVARGDAVALAAGVTRLLRDAALRLGIQRALERHAPRNGVMRCMQLMDDLLRERSFRG